MTPSNGCSIKNVVTTRRSRVKHDNKDDWLMRSIDCNILLERQVYFKRSANCSRGVAPYPFSAQRDGVRKAYVLEMASKAALIKLPIHLVLPEEEE